VSSTPAYLCGTLLRLAEAETLIESMTNDALHPDDFLLDQLDLHPGATIQALRDQAAAYRREPTTVAGLLGRLERSGLQGFAAEVRRHLP
jgi:ATP/maltotriose-dependent transcriptional regulator MalT